GAAKASFAGVANAGVAPAISRAGTTNEMATGRTMSLLDARTSPPRKGGRGERDLTHSGAMTIVQAATLRTRLTAVREPPLRAVSAGAFCPICHCGGWPRGALSTTTERGPTVTPSPAVRSVVAGPAGDSAA